MRLDNTEVKKVEIDFERGIVTFHFKTQTQGRYTEFQKMIEDIAASGFIPNSKRLDIRAVFPESLLNEVSEMEIVPDKPHPLRKYPGYSAFSIAFSSLQPFLVIDRED